MEIHDSIVVSLEGIEGHSGLNLYFDEYIGESVKDLFIVSFQEEYKKVLSFVETTFGDCSEKEDNYNPIEGIEQRPNCVCILFGNLDLHYKDCSRRPIVDKRIITGDDALQSAIKIVQKQYPHIRYEGYIGYLITDSTCQEPYQYEIASDNKIEEEKIYDFLGRALSEATKSDEFWDELLEQLNICDIDDLKAVYDSFKAYSDYLCDEDFERLLDIVEEIDEEFRDLLVEYMAENPKKRCKS